MTGTTRCSGAMAVEQIPDDLDPRNLVPDVCRETRQTVVDQIRGNQPTTVLGLLVNKHGPVSVETIAAVLNKDVEEVEWTVEVLEENGLCARLIEAGHVHVSAFAPYRP